MKAVSWAVTVAAAIVLSVFAVSNRDGVALGLWPLPYLIELPLYLLVFFTLVIGFIVGVLAVWLGAHRRRRELRRRGRRIDALERELAATQAQLETPAGSARPVLPSRG